MILRNEPLGLTLASTLTLALEVFLGTAAQKTLRNEIEIGNENGNGIAQGKAWTRRVHWGDQRDSARSMVNAITVSVCGIMDAHIRPPPRVNGSQHRIRLRPLDLVQFKVTQNHWALNQAVLGNPHYTLLIASLRPLLVNRHTSVTNHNPHAWELLLLQLPHLEQACLVLR